MIHPSCLCCRAGNPYRCANGIQRSRNNARRNVHLRLGRSLVHIWSLLLLCCLLLLPNGVTAGRIYGASEVLPRELLFDRSEVPEVPSCMPLVARQDSSKTSASTTIKPKTSASATESSIQTATQTGNAALPRPFDSSIGTNFTSSTCPDFFNDFLSNQTFNDCLPFSLLLQVSRHLLQDNVHKSDPNINHRRPIASSQRLDLSYALPKLWTPHAKWTSTNAQPQWPGGHRRFNKMIPAERICKCKTQWSRKHITALLHTSHSTKRLAFWTQTETTALPMPRQTRRRRQVAIFTTSHSESSSPEDPNQHVPHVCRIRWPSSRKRPRTPPSLLVATMLVPLNRFR
jgi:hypothetical protein